MAIYACAKTTFFFSGEFKTLVVVKRVVLLGIYIGFSYCIIFQINTLILKID